MQRFLVRLFNQYIPQLDRNDRIQLFRGLQVGSVAGMDFITLIALSTAIAALGLIQNSAAVVIGAMLVAPLMTPMLGAGLGRCRAIFYWFERRLHPLCSDSQLALALVSHSDF